MVSSVKTPPPTCALDTDSAIPTALHWLSTHDAERRFGICRTSLRLLCRRHPELAVRASCTGSPTGWHWQINAAALGRLIGHRVDLDAAAFRFGVPRPTFECLRGGRLGLVLALLPLTTRPRGRPPRPRPPEPRHAVTEADHATG